MPSEPAAEELAQRLSVLIGMIMEDEVEKAVSTASGGAAELADRLSALRQTGEDISMLAAAGEVVVRRFC